MVVASVQLLDSTLREGEQTPGVNFSLKEKLEIATLVDQFGVDIIEAGHPAISPQIKRAVQRISRAGHQAQILAHCRAIRADIDVAIDCDVDWVGIFFCLRNEALEDRYRKDLGQALALITDVVEYAKAHGLKVRYTPEDTVRSPIDNVVKVALACKAAGVDRIGVADTVGVMTPLRMYQFVHLLRERTGLELNVHCHNDLGMAVANSLTAVEAGARLIDTTVNGLGERTGIAPLAETAMALALRYGMENRWEFPLLPQLSEVVARASRIPIPAQAPVVGRNAFTHNAGLHVSAVLIDPSHYESIPAELVGRTRDVALDKMAGRPTLTYRLDRLGVHVSEELFEEVFMRIKALRKSQLDDRQLLSLVTKLSGGLSILPKTAVGAPLGADEKTTAP